MKLQIFQTKSQHTSHQLINLVARHGIEPCPLAFQTSTLPSSSRASSTLVDGARLELALHGCRPWVIPLYEPPFGGEMRESNSRDWIHNPAPKPFGQSRHRIWSWSSESNTRRRGTSSLHSHCARPAELTRRFERRSRTYEARALPTELHQHNVFKQSGGGGENCTPDDLLCRETPCCLGYTASNLPNESGAEGGTRTRGFDVGNVASWPLDDFRLTKSIERATRV